MKKFSGKVVSTKIDKTVTVEIIRIKTHPIYKKKMKVKKKFLVHDEIGVKIGNKVVIAETRPISKLKKWKVIEVIK
jgi:small subunit ribosomal protein S17